MVIGHSWECPIFNSANKQIKSCGRCLKCKLFFFFVAVLFCIEKFRNRVEGKKAERERERGENDLRHTSHHIFLIACTTKLMRPAMEVVTIVQPLPAGCIWYPRCVTLRATPITHVNRVRFKPVLNVNSLFALARVCKCTQLMYYGNIFQRVYNITPSLYSTCGFFIRRTTLQDERTMAHSANTRTWVLSEKLLVIFRENRANIIFFYFTFFLFRKSYKSSFNFSFFS